MVWLMYDWAQTRKRQLILLVNYEAWEDDIFTEQKEKTNWSVQKNGGLTI